jgi:hypothetical protein
VTVPAVLPQVVVTGDTDDTFRVAVDGTEHPACPVTGRQLGWLLAVIAEQAAGPVRVEVHTGDGARYADILQPPPSTAPPPVTGPSRPAASEPVVAVTGFGAGEPVIIAAVLAEVIADAAGVARIDTAPTRPGRGAELVVVGTRTVGVTRIPGPDRPGRSRRTQGGHR